MEGQYLDIACNANISEYIDDTVTIILNWSRNNTVLSNGTDFTISPLTSDLYQYTSTLRIHSLSYKQDNGAVYKCTVSITTDTPHVTGSNGENNITLTVASKYSVDTDTDTDTRHSQLKPHIVHQLVSLFLQISMPVMLILLWQHQLLLQ